MAKRRTIQRPGVTPGGTSSSHDVNVNETASKRKDNATTAAYQTNDGYYSSVVKRRRLEHCNTTSIIPADRDSDIPKRIQSFVTRFETNVLKTMRQEYEKADSKDETDFNGWYRGVRLITGERYEVKVLGERTLSRFSSATSGVCGNAGSIRR
eukprot:CAMPEP_0117012286 /NCGR_PEP_ID=MMETSP0472-20121206/10376_1 /TAXON_ID=693140 ORGANISM="Tiarina fusus, Strain LIS" /NCGR_SAMPLE_ID=MMETSP0472 /ASSEMBLY_ACC=CAM_ASM_000603 /LENGTH=152 /DNA_ID=CAMNT_0004715323 /DNA_START=56 /DNA_END=510 /DNA_ORIENTATION=-